MIIKLYNENPNPREINQVDVYKRQPDRANGQETSRVLQLLQQQEMGRGRIVPPMHQFIGTGY